MNSLEEQFIKNDLKASFNLLKEIADKLDSKLENKEVLDQDEISDIRLKTMRILLKLHYAMRTMKEVTNEHRR